MRDTGIEPALLKLLIENSRKQKGVRSDSTGRLFLGVNLSCGSEAVPPHSSLLAHEVGEIWRSRMGSEEVLDPGDIVFPVAEGGML